MKIYLYTLLAIFSIIGGSNGRKLTWPRGSYGLPMPASGCPLIKGYPMKEGWRLHDTENKRPSNDWSLPLHFPGPFNRNDVTQRFCMKTLSTTGGRDWPEGQFCIYMKGKCPRGFKYGWIKWDDENTQNHNKHGGSLPDGFYNRDTIIYFCCRSDGDAKTPIFLPVDKPFYLLKSSDECQQVAGMTVSEEFFRWDDNDEHNKDKVGGRTPTDTGGRRDHKLHYCYYSNGKTDPNENDTIPKDFPF